MNFNYIKPALIQDMAIRKSVTLLFKTVMALSCPNNIIITITWKNKM